MKHKMVLHIVSQQISKISLQVAYIANLIEPLAESSIGFASKLTGGAQKQTEILDKTKTVAESASQLIYAAKEAGGNPKVSNF